MKTYSILILLFGFATLHTAVAQPSYEQAMKQTIEQLNTDSVEELKKTANAFNRISQMNPEEWLPAYYSAYAYANMGFMSTGNVAEKDKLYEEAEKQLNQAVNIQEDHPEIIILKGYIMMGKLNADPANRAQQLSPKVMQTFGRVMQMDPENPRAAVMMANMKYGAAQFMGSGEEEACQLAESTVPMFEKEKEQAGSDSLMPTWGMFMAERVIQLCR